MIFLLIAWVCFTLMQFIEAASFGSRVAGKLTNRLSLGSSLQHTIFTLSRLFLPPLLFSLSFMIESGLSIQSFLMTSFLLTISAFFASLVVLLNFNYFQLLFQNLFIQYQNNSIPISILKVFFGKKIKFNMVNMETIPKIKNLSIKKIFTSIVAYLFLTTSFLVAFSFAILTPEYRMTMSQLTTLFQGFGALILTMYIDPMIGRSLDVKLENINWINNIYSIFIGRLLSYLFASIIFLSLYLYTYSV